MARPVKPVNPRLDIATATIKIRAQPDQLVSLVTTAPMANTAQMAAKAQPDQQEQLPTGSTLLHPDRASLARPDPKDPTDPLDLLDQLANPADLAAKATTANPAAPARLAQQATLAPQADPVKLVPKALLVLMLKPEAKDRLVAKDKTEDPDPLAPMEKKDPLANLAQLAPLAHQAHLAKEEKMEAKDQTALLDRKVAPARMPNTAPAPDVPRKPKRNRDQQRHSIANNVFKNIDSRIQNAFNNISPAYSTVLVILMLAYFPKSSYC